MRFGHEWLAQSLASGLHLRPFQDPVWIAFGYDVKTNQWRASPPVYDYGSARDAREMTESAAKWLALARHIEVRHWPDHAVARWSRDLGSILSL